MGWPEVIGVLQSSPSVSILDRTLDDFWYPYDFGTHLSSIYHIYTDTEKKQRSIRCPLGPSQQRARPSPSVRRESSRPHPDPDMPRGYESRPSHGG